MPDVDPGAIEIVTVAYMSREPLSALLRALPTQFAITVVDNSRARDDLAELVSARPGSTYIDAGANLGFGAACNLAARSTTRPYLLLLNPDTLPDADLLLEIVREVARDPRCAACGPALVDEDGTLQLGGGGWQITPFRAAAWAFGADRLLPRGGLWFRSRRTRAVDVEWLAGTCLALRRDVFLDIGGFDVGYFLYQEDMDLGRRLLARGYRQVLRGDLLLQHTRGGSAPGESAHPIWAIRASALVRYVHLNYSPLQAALIRATMAVGFAGRWAVFQACGRTARGREMLTYASGMAFGRSRADLATISNCLG
jgi:N-acetylglucosaminyl-diphospho-decaprenol L-rhamnosyltransferase